MRTFLLTTFVLMTMAAPLYAQTDSVTAVRDAASDSADTTTLPDAPSPAQPSAATPKAFKPASPFAKYIDPGQPAPRLRVGDKILLGLRDSTSSVTLAAWVVNALYEQTINGKPHYGTDIGAFGQRIGAAAIRDSSEDIFSESILAPILHEDPRYYILGKHHNPVHRLVYAASRAVITRTDGGARTVNFALLGGNLAGSALTQAYYPPPDRGVSQVSEIFVGSVGGSALGFVISEFFSGFYEFVRLKAVSQ